MDSDQGLKVALGWNRINMNLIGLWPEPSRSSERWSDTKLLFCLVVLIYFGTMPQNVNLFFIWGDIELMTENLSTANIPGLNVLMKFIVIWRHKDVLKALVKSFYEDWQGTETEEEKKIMMRRARTAKFISVWCSMLTLAMITVYLSLRSFIVYTSDRMNEKQDRLVLYPGYFPYNIRPLPILIFSNCGQIVAGYTATICYTTVDTFIAMLIMHLSGQFEILCRKLQKLMGDERGSKSKQQIQKDLVWIVARHEHLNWFAGKMEDCFNILLLIQMLLCTIEICFQGFLFFNVLLKNENGLLNFQFLFFVLFVGFITVHIYLYCYMGEMLLTQSGKMNITAYECNWYNVSPSEAKCLLFIMHRSTRPLCMTAGKFGTFSMEMFSAILKTAMGYLSVLLTVTGSD